LSISGFEEAISCNAVYPRLKIVRLICRDDTGKVCWLLPLVEIVPLWKRRPMLISLPFGNYGGFLLPIGVDKVEQETLSPLIDFFKSSAAFALELRETEEPNYGFEVSDTFQHFEIVFPDTAEELWEKIITRRARKKIRKAENLGVEVVHDYAEAVTVFQNLYEKNASHHGTPIHDRNWYYKLAELFSQETQIILGKMGNKYIGALLILYFQDKAIVHLAVSDPDFSTVPVTDKLLWSFFEEAVGNKTCRVIDFGRTRPEPGKLFFKRQWGGEQMPIYYSYIVKPGAEIPQILPENPKYGLAIKIWRYLPMTLKRAVGPYLRVKIPT
jgi:hypothetical protein